MSENNITNQILKEQQNQLQDQANVVTPTQQEMMEFVKYTRYASLASGRLLENLLRMTSKLEEIGYIKSDRSSRFERDKKLQKCSSNLKKSDANINDMINLISNHPDADKLIQSLFKGLKVLNTNNERTNIHFAGSQQQQQTTIKIEIDNDQVHDSPNQLLAYENQISNETTDTTDTNQNNDEKSI